MRKIFSILFAAFMCALLALPASGRALDGETTLDRTIIAEGDRDLAYGPGEGRVTRSLGWRYKAGRGRPLSGFKHVSDIHVIDEESPGRVEFFDTCPTLSSAYRVQEAMSTQVGESMLRQLATISEGPATGVGLDFMMSTGDNIDNNQGNELGWFIDLLNGDEVHPDSGIDGYHGYTQEQFSGALDLETLELAQEAFDATGASEPWYATLGNHDGLIQGNVPRSTNFQAIVMGAAKPFVNIEEYDGCPEDPSDLEALEDAFTDAYLSSSRQVPSDTRRVFLDKDDVIKKFLDASGQPNGHGFRKAPADPLAPDNAKTNKAGYYAFEIAPSIVGVSIDTLAPIGSTGSVTHPQYKWLKKTLKSYSRKYYTRSGERRRNRRGENKMIVLFSHHTSKTLSNPGSVEAEMPYHCFQRSDDPDCGGEGMKDLFQRFPNVIAWVNGHEHNNDVRGFRAPKGTNKNRGFWEINTAAHIDWPEQSRLIEIAYRPVKNRRADSVFIYGTIVDHVAAPDPDIASQDTVEYLASLSRVEAYYDACVRLDQADCAAGGEPRDRNVKLVVKAPFDLGP